tara:strand:+ start:3409 stop:3720 length:312 start_codon:yes stop_codon:yes gene_type:complete
MQLGEIKEIKVLEQQEYIEQIILEIAVDIKPETEVLTENNSLFLDLEDIQYSFVNDEITLEDLELETIETKDNNFLEDEYVEDIDAYAHLDEIDLDFDETFEY